MEFHYVDLRAFCYATERLDRVRRALELFLPDDVDVDVESTEGHYGDGIEVLSVRLERADQLRYVFDRVLDADVDLDEVEERVDDDCVFHLRLDKQRAYDGEPSLGRGIELRAKAEAYPARRENAVEAVLRSLSGSS
ncbi:MAG: RNA-binding protein [Halobacteriales archaeon]